MGVFAVGVVCVGVVLGTELALTNCCGVVSKSGVAGVAGVNLVSESADGGTDTGVAGAETGVKGGESLFFFFFFSGASAGLILAEAA